MSTERKYLYALMTILAFYVVYELQKPPETNWSQTFHYQDKIPFGTYVIHDLVEDLFDDGETDHVFDNLFGQDSTYGAAINQLILSSEPGFSAPDYERLWEYLEQGRTIMLGASYISNSLADSLGIELRFDDEQLTFDFEKIQDALAGNVTTEISLELPGKPARQYTFPLLAVPGSISKWDKNLWEPLAFGESGDAVLIRRKQGKGTLYFTTMPLAFTNYFVLKEGTSAFASSLLSLFPKDEPLAHNEYYQLGRIEPTSPIRFFLKNEALKWSIFTLMAATLLFMVFESKRRQRIIPVIKPLQNTTLEFVNVLGRLHYRHHNHVGLAKKRILYWKDFVRSNYHLQTNRLDDDFIDELIRKSGRSEATVRGLVMLASWVMENQVLEKSNLMLLEKRLNEFYKVELK